MAYEISPKEEKKRDLPETISNNGFFPDINVQDYVNQYRIPQELPDATIVNHLVISMGDANQELECYKYFMTKKGYKTLAEVPADKINEVSIKVTNYIRAVSCYAKAWALKEMQTLDRRKDADNLAKTSDETEATYRQFAEQAIKAVCGEPAAMVSII